MKHTRTKACFTVAALMIAGCAQTRTVRLVCDVEASVFKTDLTTGVETSLGKTPLRVSFGGTDAAQAFLLKASQHKPAQVLFAEAPSEGGTVRVRLEPVEPPATNPDAAKPKPQAPTEATFDQARALDDTLRAERLLLRGQIDEARRTVDRLAAGIGETFATLLLNMHIASATGDFEDAARYYEQLAALSLPAIKGVDAPLDARKARKRSPAKGAGEAP